MNDIEHHLGLIRSDSRQVNERLDAVHELLEELSQGKDKSTVDIIRAAQDLVVAAEDDVWDIVEQAKGAEEEWDSEMEDLGE